MLGLVDFERQVALEENGLVSGLGIMHADVGLYCRQTVLLSL